MVVESLAIVGPIGLSVGSGWRGSTALKRRSVGSEKSLKSDENDAGNWNAVDPAKKAEMRQKHRGSQQSVP